MKCGLLKIKEKGAPYRCENRAMVRVAEYRMPGLGPGYSAKDIFSCCEECFDRRAMVQGTRIIEGEQVKLVVFRQLDRGFGRFVKGEVVVFGERPWTKSGPPTRSRVVKVRVKDLRKFAGIPNNVEIAPFKDSEGEVWLTADWTELKEQD